MRNRWLRRGAGILLACGVAAAGVAVPAGAVNEDLQLFEAFLDVDGGTSVGTGGDGSVVLFTSSFSQPPFEDPEAAEGLTTSTSYTISSATDVADFNDADPNTILVVGHGFVAGDTVRFTATSDTLPAGLALATDYFFVAYTADRFQLSGSPGGAPIAFSDSGFGSHTFLRTTGKLYVEINPDLFRWTPGVDFVRQFTTTGDVENAAGTALAWRTENDQPAAFTRTGDPRSTETTRIGAVAFRTNADPEVEGPIAPSTDLSNLFEDLGSSGRVIVYWDSEIDAFLPLTSLAHDQECFSPSVALKQRVTNRGSRSPGNLRTIEIADAWVAFAGSANNSGDNYDGNDEIWVWDRNEGIANQLVDGSLGNNGLTQVTHTVGASCWAPAVSPRGDVAFLSDADITGENGDGSTELFLWRRRTGETRQLTKISPARDIGPPAWGDNGRRIVFASDANLAGKNVDVSMEVFVWRAGRIRQVTNATAGVSDAPSIDPFGRTIVFRTTSPLAGVTYAAVPAAEIVATPARGGRFRQITLTEDSEFNEAPTVTRSRGGKVQATWISSSNLDGRNSNNNRRIYRATVR